jgi:hypothetical protein
MIEFGQLCKSCPSLSLGLASICLARTRICSRTIACMQWTAASACRRTYAPRATAWSLTRLFSALKARRACQTQGHLHYIPSGFCTSKRPRANASGGGVLTRWPLK